MALLLHDTVPDGINVKQDRRPGHESDRSEVLMQRAREAREITKTVVIDCHLASQRRAGVKTLRECTRRTGWNGERLECKITDLGERSLNVISQKHMGVVEKDACG